MANQELEDNQTYQSPSFESDLVMKGGITSGVVFPLAICELAKKFKLKNIGGTSAGAITAAIAAAAEYGRESAGGFAGLAKISAWLGKASDHKKGSNLLNLFQAQPETSSLFHLALSQIRHTSVAMRLLSALGTLLTRFGVLPWMGILLPLPFLISMNMSVSLPIFLATLPFYTAIALMSFGVCSAWAVKRKIDKTVSKNGFGLCSGMPGQQNAGAPALTPWLYEQIQTIAGRSLDDAPITFGDLEEEDISLNIMTTCISLGKPYLMPFETKAFYFDVEDMKKLFPKSVVDWMIEHPRRESRSDTPKVDGRTLVTFPEGKDLPIVVAARMSLSFPLLLSAVPLYAINYGEARNRFIQQNNRDGDASHLPLVASQLWFSDGGICSNFPVHLFDELLPQRPTVAINLKYQKEAIQDEHRVSMVKDNRGGIATDWHSYANNGDPSQWSLMTFFSAIFDTMQNWTDNMMLPLPGYRDRIAHVNLQENEGGMNLNMDSEQIEKLSNLGREAGQRMAERFSDSEEAQESTINWESHRWTRFRSSMQMLQNALTPMSSSYTDASRSAICEILKEKDMNPFGNYSWKHKQQPEQALETMEQLIAWAEKCNESGSGFDDSKAPNPKPELRIMPKL